MPVADTARIYRGRLYRGRSQDARMTPEAVAVLALSLLGQEWQVLVVGLAYRARCA